MSRNLLWVFLLSTFLGTALAEFSASPQTFTQCATVRLSWTEDIPIEMWVAPAALTSPGDPTLRELGEINASSLDWVVDIPAGVEIAFTYVSLSQRTLLFKSPAYTVQPSNDASCLQPIPAQFSPTSGSVASTSRSSAVSSTQGQSNTASNTRAEASPSPTPNGSLQNIANSDTRIVYSPVNAWSSPNSPVACAPGVIRSSSLANSTITFRFEGTGIRANFVASAANGPFLVSLDDTERRIGSISSTSSSSCATGLQVGGLSRGFHELVITVLDGSKIDFHSFSLGDEIVGSLPAAESASPSASGSPSSGSVVHTWSNITAFAAILLFGLLVNV